MNDIHQVIEKALDDLKGQDIKKIDVIGISDVMDWLFIATGTSSRHVKSLAENVVDDAKRIGLRPIGVEGLEGGEWVLVDFGDTVVHVMQKATRDFYDLEKLWTKVPSHRQAPEAGDEDDELPNERGDA